MIIYAGFIFIILASIYTFSYAGQAWKAKNRSAAVGAVLLMLISIGLPIALMVFR